MAVFMRDSDAFTWYMERDPVMRSTVVAVAWLERSPDWDLLVARLDGATRLVPSFRQRIVEPPARLATPRWTTDPEFDLSWHLRRVAAPPPHTPRTVIDIARAAAMTAFDRARPLWEFTLVEQLAGGRAALVMKLHHSLTDGIGGMQLMLTLFDAEGAVRAVPLDGIEAPPGESPGTVALARAAAAHECGRGAGLVRGALAAAYAGARRGVRAPAGLASDVVETVRSIARTVAPVRDTRSPVMRHRGLRRDLDEIEVDLDDLKRAAAAAGGSVNDAFMAAIGGGFRRYHERHGAPVAELRVTLPISIRRPDDPVGGNRITLMRFAVPVGEVDPVARIRAMDERCRAARVERSLPYTDAIAGTLNLLPSGVVGGMLKHVDFVASDVTGFTFPVSLAGAPLERYVAFGPTIGTAVNLTLLSYRGRCCIGITSDRAAVPDPEVLVDCMRVGFDEVLALGGAHTPARRPLDEATAAAPEPEAEPEPAAEREPQPERQPQREPVTAWSA
ncbi:MAG TPA: wax ester/triacylglycerol synthase family O-acyltransferase [Acidimicrobiia bacterium]|nr:wax ester/triacylglycerol synthase family O-acyltransferase [Acidimicrobiia bacterium]